MSWEIVPLAKSHDRSLFRCGEAALDDFLKQLASQYEKRNCGRTYVLIREGENRVYGYYTIAAADIAKDTLPKQIAKKLPNHPIPVVLIGRLAVDESLKGQGLGRELLANALARVRDLSSQLGIHAVFVKALNEAAAAFYRKNDFTPLEGQPLQLFMAVSEI